jgi:cystathionine gamma-synthase
MVTFLWGHPGVESVHYPGLSEHPGHEIARSQMKGFGGRLVFRVKGGGEMAALVAASSRLITTTAAAGSSGTRIEHLAALDIPGEDPPEDMLRLSVGLENIGDLIADLDQALPHEE